MHRVLLTAALFTIPLLAQNVEIRKDDFSGATQYKVACGEAKLDGGSFFSMRSVNLIWETQTPLLNEAHPFTLAVGLITPGWTFVPSGQGMALKIDGEMLPLEGAGSLENGRVLYSDIVQEWAYFPVDLAVLKRIASAKVVQFRIFGKNRVITGEFTGKNLVATRLFVAEVPKAILPAAQAEKAESASTSLGPVQP